MANKAIPFLLLPVLTRYLSTSEFGVLALFQLMITMSTAFIGMNMHVNVSKNFFSDSKREMALLIGNILIILCVTTLTVTLIIGFLSIFYKNLFSLPVGWFQVIPLLSFMFMVNTVNLTLLRNQEKAYAFGFLEILNTLVIMAVTLLLLMLYQRGWESQATGIVCGYSLMFFIGMFHLYRAGYLRVKYSAEASRRILKISIPLIPHVLGAVVIAVSDRLYIERMVSIEMVGIYSVGYMFGMVVSLFTDAFIKAWSPWFYKKLNDDAAGNKHLIVKYTYIYVLAIFVIAIAVSVASAVVLPAFVDEKFHSAEKFIIWVALGYFVHGIYKILFPYLVYINKTKFLAISTVVAALTNLVMNFYLIRMFGAIGAAYATILSYMVSVVLVYLYVMKYFPMPWMEKVKRNEHDY